MPREVDLVQAELTELAAAVIHAAGDPIEPFGTYFFLPDDPEAALARVLEHEVFDEWFGNSPELLETEYGPYDAATVFVVVLDHARRVPAGMGRFTMASELGFKTLVDLEQLWGQSAGDVLARTGRPWDLTRVWDAGTMAVAGDYRRNATGGMVSLALLAAANRAMIMTGGHRFVTVLDVHVFRTLNQLLRDAYEAFPGVEPLSYLDSPLSIPCFVDLDRYEPLIAELDPGLHRILFDGIGIETVVRPPMFAPVLCQAGLAPGPTVTPSLSSVPTGGASVRVH